MLGDYLHMRQPVADRRQETAATSRPVVHMTLPPKMSAAMRAYRMGLADGQKMPKPRTGLPRANRTAYMRGFARGAVRAVRKQRKDKLL